MDEAGPNVTRRCRNCDVILVFGCNWSRSANYSCRICEAELRRKWTENNKERQSANRKRNNDKLKIKPCVYLLHEDGDESWVKIGKSKNLGRFGAQRGGNRRKLIMAFQKFYESDREAYANELRLSILYGLKKSPHSREWFNVPLKQAIYDLENSTESIGEKCVSLNASLSSSQPQ